MSKEEILVKQIESEFEALTLEGMKNTGLSCLSLSLASIEALKVLYLSYSKLALERNDLTAAFYTGMITQELFAREHKDKPC